MPSLLPFITWCNQTAVGTWIRTGSGWAFPIIETFHILALALLFGTTLIIDLRLLGAGMKRQRTSQIAAELWPLMMGSLALILVTGVLLFLSEAIKVYGNARLAPFPKVSIVLSRSTTLKWGQRPIQSFLNACGR
jgi:hypothetical protein